jgi:hypothetical protein
MNLLQWFRKILTPKQKHTTEYDNIVASMAKCKALYKQLIILSHPDKNLNNIELAKSITQEINANRYDYQELLRIQERIKTELK